MCELSSFQLEGVERFRADVAVLLNVTPDHLDRHGTFEPYAAAKLRVFERQRAGRHGGAVRRRRLRRRAGRRRRCPARAAGCASRAPTSGRSRRPSRPRGCAAPHNRANTACAIAVVRALGAGEAGAAEALSGFAAPAHRLEEVRELRGVRYVNDSKATNVEATLQALASFDAPLHVILGGSLKGADFAPLRRAARAHAPAPST